MTTRRFRMVAMAAGAAVVATVGVSASGVLGPEATTVVDNAAQLGGGAAAALACLWTSRRAAGPDWRWRLLMAAGMGAWTLGQAVWSWYQIFADRPIPSPSLADVGYLTLPVFALPALLVFAADREPVRDDYGHRSSTRSRAVVLVLDGLVVVGSLFILTWATALGSVVRAGAPTVLAFAVAIAYPLTDVVLVVIVVMLMTVRQVHRQLQLLFLGLGLVALAASDSLFAYLVSSGAPTIPPAANFGFVAGPVLIALAALAPSVARPDPSGRHRPRDIGWINMLAPYVPLAATGVLIGVQALRGTAPGRVEVFVGLLVIGMVVARQLITLRENMSLLDRVRQGQARLAHQAFHDPLTGLANRALFQNRLAHAVELNRRQLRPLGLLFADLDDFKAVNDSLGHAAGDMVLRSTAERLRGCVRTTDTVARLGGDEFAVLLESDLDAPERVGERVLNALAYPFTLGEHTRVVQASVGLVVPDPAETGITAEILLSRADAAMYVAKRQGKGSMVLYRPGIAARADNPDVPALLLAALRGEPGGGEFEVHFQPIVRIGDGTVVAVEALARWTHPTLGTVPPEVFIAVAERAGLIAELDTAVLTRACQQVADLRRRTKLPLGVHVNVSAGRLSERGLESSVQHALLRSGLPGGALVLEITETSRVSDLVTATVLVRRLRARGVRLALDDFGTGYSTLAQLHQLPVDMVKLDQTLTGAYPHANPERAETLRQSVISIARALEMTVVAEGVETPRQVVELARLGCDLGQGYLFGRPGPLDDLTLVPPPRGDTHLIAREALARRSMPSSRTPDD